MTPMKIDYRSDIDGLRALAVLGVLFYHLDKNYMPGGYTGVDVFFVISGYLITSIIQKEIKDGTFSIGYFYEKRIRRILPAYFFLLLFTTIAAGLILTPVPMEQYGKAMSNSLVFLSNFLFAKRVDYFAQEFNSSPLLHTWSLAVEEQFYLLWPIILSFFGMAVLRRSFRFCFIIFLVFSLLLSTLLAFTHPKLAFFMIYSRAWELGAGAFIALPFLPEVSSKSQRETLSCLGLFMICASLLFIDNSFIFPGVSASLAVFGCALVIHMGKQGQTTYTHDLLSSPLLVKIGLISYSLYLWHWPIIVFSKYQLGRDLRWPEEILAALASIFMATISYHFIERPFRKHGPRGIMRRPQLLQHQGQKVVFTTTLFLTLTLLSISVTIQRSHGLPTRFQSLNQPELYSINPLREECHLSTDQTDPTLKEACSHNFGHQKALLWGDSHADHYMPALKAWAQRNKLQLYQISKSSCLPLMGDFDVHRFSDRKYKSYEACKETNREIFALIHKNNIDTIILASRWSHFFQDNELTKPGQYLTNSHLNKKSMVNTEKIFTANFQEMASKLQEQGKKLLILGQVPFFKRNPAECYLQDNNPLSKLLGKNPNFEDQECSQEEITLQESLTRSRHYFSEMAEKTNVLFFDPIPQFCQNGHCTAKKDEKILYHDHHHLNLPGGAFLQPFLISNLKLGSSN